MCGYEYDGNVVFKVFLVRVDRIVSYCFCYINFVFLFHVG